MSLLLINKFMDIRICDYYETQIKMKLRISFTKALKVSYFWRKLELIDTILARIELWVYFRNPTSLNLILKQNHKHHSVIHKPQVLHNVLHSGAPVVDHRAQHLHIVPGLAQVLPNFHLLHLIQYRVPHQLPIPLVVELEVGFVIQCEILVGLEIVLRVA